MILDEETFEVFGYYASMLRPKSGKPILAACDDCGKIRETSKNHYHPLCNSCAQKGRIHTEETKAKISESKKGKTITEETKAKLSAAHIGKKNSNYGKRGEEASNFKGGKKLSRARADAKRRGLGSKRIYLVEEGEHEHHFTNEHIGGIPADVHQKLAGRRKKHRTRILQWLKANDKRKYEMVLCVLAKEPLKTLHISVCERTEKTT